MIWIRSNKRRVIDRLREHFPNEDWSWNRDERRWVTESGWGVYRCAALAPQHPCDDDTYVLRYYTTNGCEVVGLGNPLKLYRNP